MGSGSRSPSPRTGSGSKTPSLKQKIENNLTLTVLGLLVTGFAAGFGASQVLPKFLQDKNQGSPFVHWWSDATDLPLQQCADITRDAFRVTETKVTEDPDVTENSVAQFGVNGAITSAIVCARIGEKTTVMVFSAGPDYSETKNRNARLSEIVQTKVNR